MLAATLIVFGTLYGVATLLLVHYIGVLLDCKDTDEYEVHSKHKGGK